MSCIIEQCEEYQELNSKLDRYSMIYKETEDRLFKRNKELYEKVKSFKEAGFFKRMRYLFMGMEE